jgi:hypothetical protein
MTKTFEALVAFVAVPWAFFVAAFLYTVVFTLVVISGVALPAVLLIVGYGAPVAAYALTLIARTLMAIAAIPVSWSGPHAVAR